MFSLESTMGRVADQQFKQQKLVAIRDGLLVGTPSSASIFPCNCQLPAPG